jgi:hypothetical protein
MATGRGLPSLRAHESVARQQVPRWRGTNRPVFPFPHPSQSRLTRSTSNMPTVRCLAHTASFHLHLHFKFTLPSFHLSSTSTLPPRYDSLPLPIPAHSIAYPSLPAKTLILNRQAPYSLNATRTRMEKI